MSYEALKLFCQSTSSSSESKRIELGSRPALEGESCMAHPHARGAPRRQPCLLEEGKVMLSLPYLPSASLSSSLSRGPPPSRHRELHHAQICHHRTINNRLSQNLRHDLLYALHILVEQAGPQVKRKGSLLLHRHARSSAHLVHYRGWSNAVFLYALHWLFRVTWVV
jgi:hypothetical protein